MEVEVEVEEKKDKGKASYELFLNRINDFKKI